MEIGDCSASSADRPRPMAPVFCTVKTDTTPALCLWADFHENSILPSRYVNKFDFAKSTCEEVWSCQVSMWRSLILPRWCGQQVGLAMLLRESFDLAKFTPFGLQCLSVATVLAWGCLEKFVHKQGSHIQRSIVRLFVNGLGWNFTCWLYTL